MHTPLRTRRFHRYGSAGFSLLEMMVAIVVMGVALAFTAPNIIQSARTHKLRSAAGEVQTALARARSAAVTKKATVRLDFLGGANPLYVVREDLDNDGVYDRWTSWSRIPSGVQMTNLSFGGNNFVSFTSSGVPSTGGSITLQVDNGQRRVIRLAPGSGAATVSTPANS